jgi:dGTPase
MMEEIYAKLLCDLKDGRTSSPVFTHHIDVVTKVHYERNTPYEESDPNLIVSDYIASMTDDYFVDLYAHLFPDSDKKIIYKGYF